MKAGTIRTALASAFARRPRFERTVLALLYLERMTPDEVATAAGCSVRRVLESRTRGLAALRSAARRGPAPADLARSLSSGGRVSLRSRP